MKKLLTISVLAILVACSEKNSEAPDRVNILENLSFSVDTVVMDSGEDIFNLGMGIRSLDLSPDKEFLYYFENMPPKLLKVDLNNKKLVSKVEFEVEGPNGIGGFVGNINVGLDEKLILLGNGGFGIYDESGTKLEDLKIKPKGIDANLAGNYFNLYGNILYDWEGEKIYSWPLEREPESLGFIRIDLKSDSAKIFETPEMEIVEKYSILLEENGSFRASPQEVFLAWHENKILITCSAMGDFYEFDPKTEETRFIKIDHHVIPNRLTGKIENKPVSVESFMSEMAKVNSQIYYQKLNWDQKGKMFLRLAQKVSMPKTPDEKYAFEYYLLAYDKEFNLMGETKLELKDRIDYNAFFKDGKLYSYVNVEDELGFAVFTFNF